MNPEPRMELPIFPLPNVVFFPHTLLPLHIFEPRYRQMLADSLAGERRLAIVLLQLGWEADYDGRPPVHSVAGAGEIQKSQTRPDGRSDILLRGLGRIVIEKELPSPPPYRVAHASWLPDVYPPGGEDSLRVQAERLQHLCGRLRSTLPNPLSGFFEMVMSSDRPGAFVDRVADLVVHDIEQRQRLLEENDVERRMTEVIAYVEALLLRMERGTPGARARWN
jgi:Lon protease-like protein